MLIKLRFFASLTGVTTDTTNHLDDCADLGI